MTAHGPRAAISLAALLVLAACGTPPDPRPPAEPAPSAAEPPPAPEPKPAFAPQRVTFERGAMGTKVVLSAFTSPQIDADTLKRHILAAFEEIVRIEQLMSPWIESSDVSQINRAPKGQPTLVSPETLAVLQKSLDIAQRSEGVFDVSFEAMHGLWKFDEDVDGTIPTMAAIHKAKKLIDYRQITLDSEKRTVLLGKEGMRINLGGIAKGYAVDLAVKKLDDLGVPAFYIQAGGDLFVRGKKPDGTAFRVGVRDPRGKGPEDVFATLEVVDRAFSTAGDYERAFIRDGKRYHHIIDPRTGYPATASRSVTIWAKSALMADALDDAVFILGAEKGLALVASEPGAGAVVVTDKNEVVVSPTLADALVMHKKPTDAP